MIGWIARVLLSASAFVTAWFVAREAPNFGLVQVSLAMVPVILLIAAASFWSSLVALFRSRRNRHDDS